MSLYLIAEVSFTGLTTGFLKIFAGLAGLLVAFLVLTQIGNGFSLKKLVGAVFLGLATVAVIAASPQLASAAFDYGSSDMVGDLGTMLSDGGDGGATTPTVVEASANG